MTGGGACWSCRSLTKHWSIPGIRAGYLLGNDRSIAGLAAKQVPWSVSSPDRARGPGLLRRRRPPRSRPREPPGSPAGATVWSGDWRTRDRGARVRGPRSCWRRLGPGTREALREEGVAVRRADTFPGLDGDWVRIAVRPPETTAVLFEALDRIGAG